MSTQIQLRRGTASSWTSANPTLSQGEVGFETDTFKFKIGDGTSAWTALSYAGGLSNPMTTVGDIIIGGTVAGGVAAPARLAAGSSGDVLTSNGSGVAPSYQTPSGGGGGGFGGAEAGFTTPILADFTNDNFGGSTSATTITPGGTSGILLTDPGLTGNTNALRSLLQPITTPASPWTLTARLRLNTIITSFMSFGIVVKDSVGGKYILWGWGSDTGRNQYTYFNNANSFNNDGTPFTPRWDMPMFDGWWQFKYDGTNLLYNWSRDGNTFTTLKSEGITAFMANKPDHVGIGMNVNNGAWEMIMECFSFSITQP